METFRGLRIIAIGAAEGANALKIVKDEMELGYVEMFADFKLDEDLLVLMKGVETLFKFGKGFRGVELELGEINEIKECSSNSEHLWAYSSSQNTQKNLLHLFVFSSCPLRHKGDPLLEVPKTWI